ncbi:spore germination protein GerPE [Paenibacillus sp. EC2-1]|uniref:spore germination protein GerPE n=1 Tax=Paenibacillus sp. EC2-1 TaxID=3388665 RepID=UPI003BEECA0B
MRNSKIINVYINRICDSAVVICGESGNIVSKACGIHVQKEKESSVDEVEFTDYTIFKEEIPHWIDDHDQEVQMTISNKLLGSVIQINSVRILSVSTGSTFQVGPNRTMDLESRLKFIKEAPTSNAKGESTAG